jgi:hypothetical protein
LLAQCGRQGRQATSRRIERVRAVSVSLRTLLRPLDLVELIDADIQERRLTRSSPQRMSWTPR